MRKSILALMVFAVLIFPVFAAQELDSDADGYIDMALLPLDDAWTITGNFVNTTNPWADNEVADNITVNSTSQAYFKTKVYQLADLADSACTAAATVCDLVAAEVSNTMINTYGWDGSNDCNVQLPAGAEGYKVTFIMGVTDAAEDFYIDVTDNGIYLDGTAIGDGERVWTQEPTIAEMIVCQTFTIDGSTYDWVCNSVLGVWEDKGS